MVLVSLTNFRINFNLFSIFWMWKLRSFFLFLIYTFTCYELPSKYCFNCIPQVLASCGFRLANLFFGSVWSVNSTQYTFHLWVHFGCVWAHTHTRARDTGASPTPLLVLLYLPEHVRHTHSGRSDAPVNWVYLCLTSVPASLFSLMGHIFLLLCTPGRFVCKLVIMNFILLKTGFSCVFMNMMEFCSRIQSS